MSMDPRQTQQYAQQGSFQPSWAKEQNRTVITSTVEVPQPQETEAQRILSQAGVIPGIGYKFHQDPQSRKTKVTLTLTRQAAQRMQEVQRLQSELSQLALYGQG
jgi:hypothetical protein